MYIAGLSKYATTYSYGSDGLVSVIVLPRGNRIDLDLDSSGNLLTRRHKTTNTSTNGSGDILHT